VPSIRIPGSVYDDTMCHRAGFLDRWWGKMELDPQALSCTFAPRS